MTVDRKLRWRLHAIQVAALAVTMWAVHVATTSAITQQERDLTHLELGHLTGVLVVLFALIHTVDTVKGRHRCE